MGVKIESKCLGDRAKEKIVGTDCSRQLCSKVVKSVRNYFIFTKTRRRWKMGEIEGIEGRKQEGMMDEGRESVVRSSPNFSKNVEDGCLRGQYKTRIEARVDFKTQQSVQK